MTAAERRAHLRASDAHDAWDALPSITAPTLVLHGSDDEMTPAANAALLASRIPGAHLYVLERGRHGFFDEFADAITPRVCAFLTGEHPPT
jgi:pimeloyl-ACP methyl ester carboxylesterase